MYNVTKDLAAYGPQESENIDLPYSKVKYKGKHGVYDHPLVTGNNPGTENDAGKYTIGHDVDVLFRTGAALRDYIDDKNAYYEQIPDAKPGDYDHFEYLGSFKNGIPAGQQALQHTYGKDYPAGFHGASSLTKNLCKIIFDNMNQNVQKVLSSKAFMQVELQGNSQTTNPKLPEQESLFIATNDKPWPVDQLIVLSLPIAEFVSSEFTDLMGPDDAKEMNKLFEERIPTFLKDPNAERFDFEDKLIPALLFGLANTENVEYFINEQLDIATIMNLFPIYNALKNEDLNLAKFFLLGGAPLAEHNKMLDGMLDNLINFDER
jgi:hypothetical protein